MDFSGLWESLPRKVEKLINSSSGNDEITCVMTELLMGQALEVAVNMKVKRAIFFPASAALLATSFNIPKLIDDGIVDEIGTPLKIESIMFSPGMPEMKPSQFVWAAFLDIKVQKLIFESCKLNRYYFELAEMSIANSSNVFEPAAFSLVPNLLPMDPLLSRNRITGSSASGSFWSGDSICLNWLDQQAPSSVTYVAFGSITVFDKTQFQELALELELTNRPFLWVVRPDITKASAEAYPDGFLERVANQGKIVSWAPQQKVLSHPAIACFLSHCGWNSTMEGVSNGLPFLCWPYFADQFLNETYIVDVWKTGLGLERNENGMITRDEIVAKIRKLIGDKGYKERAIELKSRNLSSTREGGSSYDNFTDFIKWMKTT